MNIEDELRIVKNFLNSMTKSYASRTLNLRVVGDILLIGTRTSGMTSCVAKCRELGIDPYGHNLEVEK